MSMISNERLDNAWGLTLEHEENAHSLVMVGSDVDGSVWLDIDGRATFLTRQDVGHLLSALGAALRPPATSERVLLPAAG